MADVNFIEFYDTLDNALTERTSPQINLYEVRGIQLLPNNTLPYVQTTNINGGISLEDWTVYIVNTWDLSETDISAYFVVESIFADENGDNQFTWSITNVPNDFGNKMVYLKATQTIGETFYSNMFQLTYNNSDRTTRIDYKSYNIDTMQSIQLRMWYWQTLKNQEVSTYYETSTRNTVTNVIKSQKYEHWLTDSISNSLFLKISDIFQYKYVYVNLIKSNLFENLEIKEHSGTQNYTSNILKLAFNSGDIYNPLAVEIPVVEPLIPSITLIDVVANGTNAIYTFSFANFTPSYLTFQTSETQLTWNSTNAGTTSAQIIPFSEIGTWSFRIVHPLAESNIIQLDLGAAVDAVDDAVQCEKGGIAYITPLLNDALVGTVTITALSTPTNGTAVVIDGGLGIQYTHNDSATVFDTFTYTISNGSTSDTATVSVTVTAISGGSGSFLTSATGETTKSASCVIALNTTRYFNNIGVSEPQGGYTIYTDAALTTVFDGEDKWYPITGGKAILINSFGIVIDKQLC